MKKKGRKRKVRGRSEVDFRILTDVKKSLLRRRTKILCTMGPTSSPPDIMRSLMLNGMDGARLNFSHGSSYRGYRRMIEVLRGVAKETGHEHFCILQDLQGPKIRVGKLKNRQIWCEKGETFIISSKNDFVGNSFKIGCTYPNFAKDVIVGKDIFIDDGRLKFRIESKRSDTEVVVKTIVGGMIYENKGINIPNMPISSPILTEKDRRDLRFGLEQRVDYICLSFVSSADDILACHNLMNDKKFNPSGYTCPIFAKIERQQAIDNLSSIIQMVKSLKGGGIMVARGDLAVETGFPKLAILQKRIISECLLNGVTVITATELLISMMQKKRPDIPEVCDVTNAVLDGSSVLMLSNETATGKYPVETTKVLNEIITHIENDESNIIISKGEENDDDDDVKCVVISTGRSEEIVLKYIQYTQNEKIKKKKPIFFAFTTSKRIFRRLSLIWGMIPVLYTGKYFDEERVKKYLTRLIFDEDDLERKKGVECKDSFLVVSEGDDGLQMRSVPFF